LFQDLDSVFLYYDRIIPDSAEMNRITEYIENNVAEWDANKDIDYQID